MQTILLVEDDPKQRILYGDELSQEGYQVVCADNGREAVEQMEAVRPDVVVLDISMPIMDGLEALQKLLAKNDRQKVVINTAYSSYKDNFVSWSADAYVVKSSNLDELKTTIRDVLDPSQERPLPAAEPAASLS